MVLALDIGTKVLVVAELEGRRTLELLGGQLLLRVSRNPGAAFSFAEGATVLFTAVALAVVVVIVRVSRRLHSRGWAVALGLLLGGASGNLVDRLLRTPGAMERIRDDEGPQYVQAVCHETLRLRPVIPLVLRRLTEAMTMVHRRPDLYPEPHAFRPERFLGVKPGTYTWIPFGGGVRRCLGASFALFEMQAVLEAVAGRTRLRAASPAPEHTRRRTITFAPDRGAEVVLVA